MSENFSGFFSVVLDITRMIRTQFLYVALPYGCKGGKFCSEFFTIVVLCSEKILSMLYSNVESSHNDVIMKFYLNFVETEGENASNKFHNTRENMVTMIVSRTEDDYSAQTQRILFCEISTR